jgi:hypothetical protein
MSDFGYVTSYVKNSDETYACTLISDVKDNNTSNIQTLSSTPDFPIKTYNINKTTTNINCIGILNSNLLVSPNNGLQMTIMSNDNKYIFIPVTNKDQMSSSIISYYLSVYTTLKYNTKLPMKNYYSMLNDYINSPKYTTNDLVYNNIPESSYKETIKTFYRGYLTGLNPPDILLEINPSVSVWKDIGYLYYTMYNYYTESLTVDPTMVSSNTPVPGSIIPKNICIQTDTQNILPDISKYDCRNITNGSPIILLENNTMAVIFGSTSGISSCCSSLVSFILIILLIVFLLGGFSRRKSNQVIIRKK